MARKKTKEVTPPSNISRFSRIVLTDNYTISESLSMVYDQGKAEILGGPDRITVTRDHTDGSEDMCEFLLDDLIDFVEIAKAMREDVKNSRQTT